MSEKSEKRLRRAIRKNYRIQYNEFLKLTEELTFMERLKICYAVMRKLGSVEKRRRLKLIKKRIQQSKEKT